MARQITGKVVVITGASSGIGRATALAFARQGANLVLAARDDESLRQVAAECETVGAPAIVVPTDVRDEQAVNELARRAVEAFDGIDVWVNNAAVYMLGRFENVPPESFRELYETNVFGTVNGCRAAIPYLRQSKGVLINVASMAATMGIPYGSAYNSSKWAVRGFADCLREELRRGRHPRGHGDAGVDRHAAVRSRRQLHRQGDEADGPGLPARRSWRRRSCRVPAGPGRRSWRAAWATPRASCAPCCRCGRSAA